MNYSEIAAQAMLNKHDQELLIEFYSSTELPPARPPRWQFWRMAKWRAGCAVWMGRALTVLWEQERELKRK